MGGNELSGAPWALQRIAPRAELRDLVQCLWSLRPQACEAGAPGTPVLAQQKIYPDGGSSLVIALAGSRPDATLTFNAHTQTQPFSYGVPVLSARFTPGAMYQLFGLSPTECLAGDVRLTDVLSAERKRQARTLLERLASASPAESLALLERWLTQWRGESPLQRSRVSQLPRLLSAGSGSLNALSAAMGMSARTLERHCRREIGLTPGFLHECLRQQRARDLLAGSARPLSDIALACGFYDQAHFSHAFSQFVGETPGAYRQRKLSQIYKR